MVARWIAARGSRQGPRGNNRRRAGQPSAANSTTLASGRSARCWNASSSTATRAPSRSAWRSAARRSADTYTGTDGLSIPCTMTSSPPYPRITTAGRSPLRSSLRAIQAVSGVFPVPPTVKFPTTIVAIDARDERSHPRS